ncbi:D-lyxose/D-mannose family sugar isomerase [Commensalibacter sp. TBRC 16381]|uniref:D-lyxose ketol-isomerase n=1 Tax=Commensalibacter oyaizuii TaxID=3043873 RepID=A0ABT6Q2X2_9PROT|nr:D-lyxose/D-mannose family sugar isomerase [Commensalibacter sp. TBRC 16381]MDI2090911.1 D-lyxose/D-mannose family sugar isomerase [Commensalibacter sp. TBRC 16381]
MKRSEINLAVKEMQHMIEKIGYFLPPFRNFTPKEWENKIHEYVEVKDNLLGWDVTDCGKGKFDKVGFTLITLRNGNVKNKKYKKLMLKNCYI